MQPKYILLVIVAILGVLILSQALKSPKAIATPAETNPRNNNPYASIPRSIYQQDLPTIA